MNCEAFIELNNVLINNVQLVVPVNGGWAVDPLIMLAVAREAKINTILH